ncbi:S-adenosyl-L-methionine-dependent methyltransferase [Collybia nuda]|uniref:S-adenosyl-L-methionine-dependent methyltransferase n=1 Tax=Collybia nuda TaxID=64659 RepID=A0A9P5YBD0_9AGAR|nr:S-adenosyl-L-methionine-dependent methyltransferase [Collybia nuda]
MDVHTVAKAGFGIGTNDLYDRARPSYQPLALSYIRHVIEKKTSINVAEIGAGTGIFTRALLAHPEWSSNVQAIKAVEPSDGMRNVFSRTVKDNRVTLSEGTFEKTGIDNQWADLIVIAQAFHWCPDFDRASAEFSRILKPHGAVVFIWNLEDRDTARWVAQLREHIEQHEDGTPQFRLGLWRKAFDTPSYQGAFLPPSEKSWTYTLPTNVGAVLSRAASKSYIAILPEDEKLRVQSSVKEIVEKGEDKVWIDESKGIFLYPYKCYVVVSQKK